MTTSDVEDVSLTLFVALKEELRMIATQEARGRPPRRRALYSRRAARSPSRSL